MTNSNDQKIKGHAFELYAAMADRSIVKDDTVQWHGSIAALLRELKINQGYQTLLMRLLTQTDCLRQARKGSKNIPSVYVLMRDPASIPEAEWPSAYRIVKSRAEGLTTEAGGYKLLSDQIRAVAERLPPGLNLAKALTELQTQINDLSDKLQQLKVTVDSLNNNQNK